MPFVTSQRGKACFGSRVALHFLGTLRRCANTPINQHGATYPSLCAEPTRLCNRPRLPSGSESVCLPCSVAWISPRSLHTHQQTQAACLVTCLRRHPTPSTPPPTLRHQFPHTHKQNPCLGVAGSPCVMQRSAEWCLCRAVTAMQ